MTEDRDYLWDPRGPADADAFSVELERRLAPLDDAEALLAGLDLLDDEGELADAPDGGEPQANDADDAVVLVLHEAHGSVASPRRADEARRRSWPWLAAAIAVLGLSVGVLATESQSRRDVRSPLEISAGTHDGHVVITAPDPSIHALLRPAHEGLSACALTLEPEDSVSLSATIDAATVELSESSNTALRDCLVATFAALEITAPTTIELELHGPVRLP